MTHSQGLSPKEDSRVRINGRLYGNFILCRNKHNFKKQTISPFFLVFFSSFKIDYPLFPNPLFSPQKLFTLTQQFSASVLQHTGVPEEFLKHAISDHLVRGTDLFSLRLSTTTTKKTQNRREPTKQQSSSVNQSKLQLLFFVSLAKYLACHRIL